MLAAVGNCSLIEWHNNMDFIAEGGTRVSGICTDPEEWYTWIRVWKGEKWGLELDPFVRRFWCFGARRCDVISKSQTKHLQQPKQCSVFATSTDPEHSSRKKVFHPVVGT